MYQNVKITKQQYLRNYATDLNNQFQMNELPKKHLTFEFHKDVVQKLWKEMCSRDYLISLMFLTDGWTDFHKIGVKWKI